MRLYDRLLIDTTGIGNRFGDWTQLGASFALRVGNCKKKSRIAVCECKCGRVAQVDYGNLRTGRSNGCTECRRAKIGDKKTRHGMSKTRVHNIWWGMIVRCTNPNVACWEDYGGRGIAVCERWHTFENFYEDMGEPPQGYEIDRLNENGNYELSNCRWASGLEQGEHKRNNVRLTYNGKEMTAVELGKQIGIPSWLLLSRLRKGWSIEDATRPRLRNRRSIA